MVHDKLPIMSLLCLLLMLPPELTLGKPECLFKVPPIDLRQREAIQFAIYQYNQDNQNSSNYFKEVNRLEVITEKVANGVENHLTVNIVKTRCKKRTRRRKTYKAIQQCQELLGNKKKKTCYFKVTFRPPSNKLRLEVADCEKTPQDPVCMDE